METDERSRPSHSVTEEKQFSSWLAIECVLGGLLFIVQLDKESHNRYRCVCQPLQSYKTETRGCTDLQRMVMALFPVFI